MFTGIVAETGTIRGQSRSRITIRARRSLVRELTRGTSVAVDGACLTVVSKTKDYFSADIMPETVRCTTLSDLQPGTVVNLELPATPQSFLSGHVVQGHVDAVGTLISLVQESNGRVLKFSLPRMLSKYIVDKGSIAINGISLTVVRAGKGSFTVGIIPHTWEKTSLRSMELGEQANIEVDCLAKYIEKLTEGT